MIEQGQIYTVEFQNLRRVHRNRAVGELFAIEIEITESEWHHLSSFPQDAIGDAALRWNERAMNEEKPKKEKKAAPVPSPYGQFWHELDRTGFHNRPDVRRWLECGMSEEGIAKDSIRKWFAVESRAKELSPAELIEGMQSFNREMLAGAITAAETAKRKVEGMESR